MSKVCLLQVVKSDPENRPTIFGPDCLYFVGLVNSMLKMSPSKWDVWPNSVSASWEVTTNKYQLIKGSVKSCIKKKKKEVFVKI